MMYGEIWWVDFGVPYGSEPGFKRPAVVVQNNNFNESKIGTTVVVPLTTNLLVAEYDCNVILSSEETKLSKDSVAQTPLISSVDKSRLVEKVGKLPQIRMIEILKAIKKLFNIV